MNLRSKITELIEKVEAGRYEGRYDTGAAYWLLRGQIIMVLDVKQVEGEYWQKRKSREKED